MFMYGAIMNIKNLGTAATFIFLLGLLVLVTSCNDSPESAAYKDSKLTVQQRVEDLLARMTLEEKIQQLSGVGFDTKENKRLGIPVLSMNDGPVGVRWGKATAFPAAVGIAASWNPELTLRIGEVIARETKAKGRNYLLGPCVNIHRFPLGGRNFESYGEDPFLAARLAAAFVKGIQSQGVLASVKHYACNNQEWERHKLDVTVAERALREIYLPAFKAAVQEGKAYTVMAAYNVLRGDHCSESAHLLDTILKKEWGFRGFVVSDWRSVYSTVKSAKAGLDLEMPVAEYFGEKLLEAVKKGEVKESVIDDKIRRLMRVRFKAGLFDHPPKEDESVLHREEHKKLALKAAQQSLVLLKNNNKILPLDQGKLKTLAVIGPNALDARVGGGGSSKVTPFYAVSPMQGLKKALGKNVKIKHALGIAIRGDIDPLRQAFHAEYFNNIELKGKPVMKRVEEKIDFNWGYDAPHPSLHRPDDRNTFSVRWVSTIEPPKTGKYRFQFLHNDGMRAFIGDKPIFDNWKKNRIQFKTVTVPLQAGKKYSLRIEYFFDGGISQVKFGWILPDHDYIAEAAGIAKQCDAAIIFAGLYERWESESWDRRRMELPNQDLLIDAVAKANPNTIVVMQTGSPVFMPWLDKVAAVVQAWYPGQEGGNAIADVLLGNVNPAGKLPFSFISSYDHSPAFKDYKDKSLKSPYAEGIFVGYRYLDKHRIKPLFPFGHGLSYTTFRYSGLKVEPEPGNHTFKVSLKITNTGKRAGTEIVQLYISDIESSLERPEKELKGFARIHLNPGQSKTVTLKLNSGSFAFFDPNPDRWRVETGDFEVSVGSSSEQIQLKKRITIH